LIIICLWLALGNQEFYIKLKMTFSIIE